MKRRFLAISISKSRLCSSNCDAGTSLVFTSEFHSASKIESLNHRNKFLFYTNDINSPEEAMQLYKQMILIRPLPSVIQFTQLLGYLVKMGKYSDALSVYRNMLILGVAVDAYTMSIVINCFCLMYRVDLGFSIFGGFFKRGFLPNVTTFTTLLKGLFREDRIEEAQKLFKKIIRENLCEPNEVMYGTVIDGLCKIGNTGAAIDLLRVMERGKCRADNVVYNSIIDGLCKNKLVDEAFGLVNEMVEKGISPTVVTYNSLIGGLCNLGKWKEANNLIAEMVGSNIAPNLITFSILMDALCKKGRVKDAEVILQTMTRQGVNPDVVTYTALVDGYCLQGRMTEARKVFDSMIAAGLAPCNSCYSILINGYCKKMEMNEAVHLIQGMPIKDIQPTTSTYNAVLQGLFRMRMDKFQTAKEIFNQMLASGTCPNFHTHCILLDGLCKSGHDEEALLLLHTMESTESDLRLGFYSIIIARLCKGNKLRLARGFFSRLPLKGFYPNAMTYNAMICGFCEHGLFTEAKELLVKMEDCGYRPDKITYSVMIRGFLKWGKYDDASIHIEKMVKKGFSHDSYTVSALLDLLAAKEKSLALFNMLWIFVPDDK